MREKKIQIVDYGRGAQIEGHRLTVMDVFYYLHRGRDFDFIHRAMPSLTRPEFDAVVEYVNEHRDELSEADRRMEERIRREIADQKAKGIRREIDESIPFEARVARLRKRLHERIKEQAENGAKCTR